MKFGEIGLFLQTKPPRFLLVIADQSAELPLSTEDALKLAGALIQSVTPENSATADEVARDEECTHPGLPIGVN